MKQLLAKVPAWFPLGFFTTVAIAGGVVTLLAVILFVAALDERLVAESLAREYKIQEILSPAVKSLRSRNAVLRRALVQSDSSPMPESAAQLITELERLASESGLADSRLVPDATSLVSGVGIKVTGHAMGSSEAMRRFLIKLGGREWLRSLDAFTMESTLREPRLKLSLTATYKALLERERASGGRS